MSTPEDPRPRSRKTRLLVAIAIALLVAGFIAIHLTGVIGPGSH